MTNYMKNLRYWAMAEEDETATFGELRAAADNPADLEVVLTAYIWNGELAWSVDPETLEADFLGDNSGQLTFEDIDTFRGEVEDRLDIAQTVKSLAYQFMGDLIDEEDNYWEARAADIWVKDRNGTSLRATIRATIRIKD